MVKKYKNPIQKTPTFSEKWVFFFQILFRKHPLFQKSGCFFTIPIQKTPTFSEKVGVFQKFLYFYFSLYFIDM